MIWCRTVVRFSGAVVFWVGLEWIQTTESMSQHPRTTANTCKSPPETDPSPNSQLKLSSGQHFEVGGCARSVWRRVFCLPGRPTHSARQPRSFQRVLMFPAHSVHQPNSLILWVLVSALGDAGFPMPSRTCWRRTTSWEPCKPAARRWRCSHLHRQHYQEHRHRHHHNHNQTPQPACCMAYTASTRSSSSCRTSRPWRSA